MIHPESQIPTGICFEPIPLRGTFPPAPFPMREGGRGGGIHNLTYLKILDSGQFMALETTLECRAGYFVRPACSTKSEAITGTNLRLSSAASAGRLKATHPVTLSPAFSVSVAISPPRARTAAG